MVNGVFRFPQTYALFVKVRVSQNSKSERIVVKEANGIEEVFRKIGELPKHFPAVEYDDVYAHWRSSRLE